ncbi:MAG TPA: EAL domain-containing protein [Gemmatimonadaceae bacterium]|nr:EAL domain-containing protein [Gemmatimonadaceae bacterium]
MTATPIQNRSTRPASVTPFGTLWGALQPRPQPPVDPLRGSSPAARILATLPEGSMPALVTGVACIIFISQTGATNLLSSAAFIAVTMVLLVLVRRVASVKDDVALLANSEARFRSLVQNSSDVIFIVEADTTIRYTSPSAQKVLGVRARELVGTKLINHVHPDDRTLANRFFHALLESQGGVPSVEDWRLLRTDGPVIWTENTGTNLVREPTVGGVVVNMRDVSERRTLQSRLAHQAFHDELTRLANRALFLNRVEHTVARVPRGKHPSAVLFLDLDDFKKVNDSLGHAVGDELLVATASRLTTCVRPGDTIARLGGDEFAVLLEDVDGMTDVVAVAERISTALSSSFQLGGRDVFIGVSIGIASMEMGDSPDEVLRNADLAMYFAKSRRKGQFAVYEPSMHDEMMEHLELEVDLRGAVERNEFEIHYQPIVNLVTGELYGAEALLRWNHPTRGPVPPSRFISLAEETGLIIPLGRWVLKEACEKAREWRTRFSGRRPLQISVNISVRHFQDPTLLQDVQEALNDSGVEPWSLTLEITESVLMHSSEATLARLRALKALGLKLAIDDFGTGYSSLGYLQQFPIDLLKIDRSFVEAVGIEEVDPVLARAIIALGRTMQIETIAEGIERPEQREGLRVLGCSLGQGYYFAKPMSAQRFANECLNKTFEASPTTPAEPQYAFRRRA